MDQLSSSLELSIISEYNEASQILASQSSGEEVSIFELPPLDDPRSKRFHRHYLTFLRDYYKTIISILLCIILLMLLVNVWLIVKPQKVVYIHDLAINESTTIFNKLDATFGSNGVENDNSNVIGEYVSVLPVQTTSIVTASEINITSTMKYDSTTVKSKSEVVTKQAALQGAMVEGRTFCQKMRNKCNSEVCLPSDTDYYSIRTYTCCCLPNHYKFVGFEELVSSGIRSITIRDIEHDLKQYSSLDVELLPELNGLPGTWQVITITDSEYVLKYTLA